MNFIETLNLKFARNTCVRCLHLDVDQISLTYNMVLSLSADESFVGDGIEVLFEDISGLNLKDFGGGLSQFMRLRVEPHLSGFDRVKYVIQEVEDENILFFCKGFEILSVV